MIFSYHKLDIKNRATYYYFGNKTDSYGVGFILLQISAKLLNINVAQIYGYKTDKINMEAL